jgi:hypothetical protein
MAVVVAALDLHAVQSAALEHLGSPALSEQHLDWRSHQPGRANSPV